MKGKKKKPDMVVDEPQLMKYPTNVGSPAFIIPDILAHKSNKGENAIQYLNCKFEELKNEYFKLSELANDTEMIYNSKHNFIPIVGNIYHLYKNNINQLFLSIIGPTEWDMEYKGSFKYTTDGIWKRVVS